MKLNTSQWEYLTQFARSLLIRSGEIRFNYTDPSDLISAAFLNLKDQEVTIIQLQKEIRKEFYKQRNERASNKKHFIDTSANDHKACPKCRITFAAMEFKPRINKHGILVYNGYCPGCTADYQRYWRRTEKGRECMRRIGRRYRAELNYNYLLTLLVASAKGAKDRGFFRRRPYLLIERKLDVHDKRLGIEVGCKMKALPPKI